MTQKLTITAAWLLCFLQVFAQNTLPDSMDLNTVTVSATRLPTGFQRTPVAISLLDSAWIRKGQLLVTLQEALVAAPGVYISNTENFTQDLRIAVRGFGARSAFGIRGIRLMVDGLPETTPDGQGQLDNIDPQSIHRIEVLRGPAAALYGNASGGVISMHTDTVPGNLLMAAPQAFGSFGYRQERGVIGFRRNHWTAIAQYTQTERDGYRRHSYTESSILNAKIRYKSKIQFIFNVAYSPQSDDPGALNLGEAKADPRAASGQNLLFEAGERVTQVKSGMTGTEKVAPRLQLDYYGFGIYRDFENRLPVRSAGIVALERVFGGAGAALTYTKARSRWRFHLDAESQRDQRTRYDNDEGEQGSRRLDQLERFNNVAAGGQWQWTPDRRWQTMAALRYDRMGLGVDDAYILDGDDSGSALYHNLNPMLGLSYTPRGPLSYYANFATAFETPTLTELAHPNGGGGLNPDLRPQRSRSMEAGVKGRFRRIQYDVAAFRIAADDEIAPFELDSLPNRTFYRNAGATLRHGVEIAVLAPFFRAWALRATWNVARYAYVKAPEAANDGNFLPGLPNTHGLLAVQRLPAKGWFMVAQAQYTGTVFADDANLVSVAPVWLFSARAGYTADWWEAFAGGNNLANTRYFSNLRLNAVAGRYYEPGPGIGFYLGAVLRLDYRKPIP